MRIDKKETINKTMMFHIWEKGEWSQDNYTTTFAYLISISLWLKTLLQPWKWRIHFYKRRKLSWMLANWELIIGPIWIRMYA